MVTQKFKATLGASILVVVAGALGANQIILQHEVKNLEKQVNITPKVVIATPSITPTATPTATLKFAPIKTFVTVAPTK